MNELFKPIKPATPVQQVVRTMEDHILEGRLKPGDKLPPERELAAAMNVSRPVIHEGLLELAAKGLITMKPRHGSWINDYRRSGSLELLNALYRYNRGALEPHLDEGMEEMRRVILKSSIQGILKPESRGEFPKTIQELRLEYQKWLELDRNKPQSLAESDFNFYFSLVYNSGNPIYPLIFNSAREMYIGLLSRFFTHKEYYGIASKYKLNLIDALESGESEVAFRVIEKLCTYATYDRGYGE
ncbi:MAG: FadR family transcriptional regulator [Spirochaetales bacterium]|nr:FadR family transcriptional regulator [Spirochaetales bacterium]